LQLPCFPPRRWRARSSLSEYVRCCVAVGGGASGAAATAAGWRFLRSGVTVWLAAPGEDTNYVVPQQAEILVRLGEGSGEAFEAQTVAQVLDSLLALVEENHKDFVGKKSLYARFGCREDLEGVAQK